MAKTKAVSSSASAGVQKKKRRSGGTLPFANAIGALKKDYEPSIGLTTASVFLLNDIAQVILDRLIQTSGKLAKYDGKSTMKTRHAATAAQLIFAGGMQRHVGKYADDAVQKFEAAIKA